MLTPLIEDRGHYLRSKLPEIPDLLACHQINPQRYPFLLESASSGNAQARYSMLLAFPERSLQLNELGDFNFLAAMDLEWCNHQVDSISADDDLPFQGGWFVYLGYELLGEIEATVSSLKHDGALPIAQMTRVPAAVIIDTFKRCCWIVAESGREDLIDLIRQDLANVKSFDEDDQPADILFQEESDEPFIKAVHQTLDYCLEGDIFQANLSRLWQATLPNGVGYRHIYQALREHNPAPFAGLAKLGDATICSSSPERLVRAKNQHIEMRPIAGTRPRGVGENSDKQYSKELLAHPKERAEHLMLLDLIRNDLGRVCEYGSIHVDEHMILESYATVHHIVSNVVGTKRSSVTPGDVIRAVFPGGTITGCPKVRCMQIIAELERAPRGAYTGSMGYINRNGDMDLNILIRTLVIKKQQAWFRAGAGIVADSNPHAELKETRDKAQGLLQSLHVGNV